jgi:hypothetical protein
MNMSKKWMMLILLILVAMIASGCTPSREARKTYNEVNELFQKATAAGAKKCAPCQYGTAEAYLTEAGHEIGEWSHEDHSFHFDASIKIVKEKSLEALRLTPCEKPAPRARAPEPPKPAPVVKERCQELIPPTAKPGECYARILVPERYQTFTERVLTRQASEKIETIPAKYETVEQRVLVKEASRRFEEVPAEYGWVEEKVLVEAAHSEWKKGRGIIEKVDNATGEIMCLVEIPAKYETVRRRVVTKPASVRVVEIPAEYETIKVTKMVSPPQEKRIPIPEEYGTITRKEKVADSCLEWRKVLCETNMSPGLVMKIQQALSRAGYNPGPIDGTYGSQTRAAVASYQKAKGFGEGELTYETIESLGVKTD